MTTEQTASGVAGIELQIGGMTCASCANRIEKKLNKLDGVSASVNLATESARITAPSAVSVDDLLATVARAGYTGALLDAASPDEPAASEASPAGEPASTTSAAPLDEETERPPCLATFAPAAAATNMAVVEILKVFAPSPPVPTISTSPFLSATGTGVANSRITAAAAVISETVSTLILRPVRMAAICSGGTWPLMI